MSIDYQTYLKGDLYTPLGLFILSSSLNYGLVRCFQEVGTIGIIIGICIASFFPVIFLIQIIRGCSLLRDRSLDVSVEKGVVERIEDIKFGATYSFGEDIVHSVYITVAGKRFRSISIPEIAEGDFVCIVALVHSKCVLSYAKE